MFEGLRSMFRRNAPRPAPHRRGYAAAQLSRWMEFFTSLEVAHKERQRDLPKLRSHSRDLAHNNVYAARYISLVSTNIVGPKGIGFESGITGGKGQPKSSWNTALEEGYAEWSKCCTVDCLLSRAEMEQLVAETAAQDGECLIRLVRGFANKWRFAVEVIDADRLDHEFNTTLANGNRIIMGVEVDPWGKPLAFHLWTQHPQDYEAGARERVRVPASDILHVYRKDRARATRGVPWMTAAMVQINMLGKLWTSELAAATWESNRLGVIKSDVDAGGDVDAQATAAEMSSDIATFMGLDPGLDVVFPQIQHPNAILPQFSTALLQGASAGLGVAHHSLTGNVSDANYSSSRVALLSERDMWRKLQPWFIASVSDPIYRAWLEMAILAGAIQIPGTDLDRLCAPTWWPRTWEWVDPEKDEKSSWNAISHGLSTHQEELGRQGKDWRDVIDRMAEFKEYAESKGVLLPMYQPAPASPKPDKEGADAQP